MQLGATECCFDGSLPISTISCAKWLLINLLYLLPRLLAGTGRHLKGDSVPIRSTGTSLKTLERVHLFRFLWNRNPLGQILPFDSLHIVIQWNAGNILFFSLASLFIQEKHCIKLLGVRQCLYILLLDCQKIWIFCCFWLLLCYLFFYFKKHK